jgi:hypothetical protein
VARLATCRTGEVREFLASDQALIREVFDGGASDGATWPARVLLLLPGTVHGHIWDARGRKNLHLLTPEGWMA